MTPHIGMIVGKFYPLHQGHINMILQARQLVDQLIVFVCSDSLRDLKLFEESAMTRLPSSEDRTDWAKQSFAAIPGIRVESFLEDGIPAYPNGWQAWSERLQATLDRLQVQPTIIFSSEPQDEALYRRYFNLPVQLMDPPRSQFNVSATEIRTEPYRYWHFIPTHIRPFFTKRILVEKQFTQTLLLQSVTALFQSVEHIHSTQLEFIPIDQSQLTSSLQAYQHQGIRLNGVIASRSFIAQTLDTLGQITADIDHSNIDRANREIAYYNRDAPITFQLDEKRNDALIAFQDLSHFIAQILKMSAIKVEHQREEG